MVRFLFDGGAKQVILAIVPARLACLPGQVRLSAAGVANARKVYLDGIWSSPRGIAPERVPRNSWLYVDGGLYYRDKRGWVGYVPEEGHADGSCIEARCVTKSYGASKKPVIDDLNIRIESGELIALCGKSGQGKSTFMEMLVGRRSLAKGRFVFEGSTGFVPQRDLVHESLTVEEQFNYYANFKLDDENDRRDVVDKLIAALYLEQQRYQTIVSLSGGQRKRVCVGIELIRSPNVLALDEPTSGLDIETEA